MDLCENFPSIVAGVGDLICLLIRGNVHNSRNFPFKRVTPKNIVATMPLIYQFSTPSVPKHKVPWIIILQYAFEMTELIKKTLYGLVSHNEISMVLPRL